MKAMVCAFLSLAVLQACSNPSEPPPPHILLVERIDAKVVTSGLPISGMSVDRSSNGQKRVTWKVAGAGPLGHLEIIGNDQSNADQVGFACAEFDAKGNLATQMREDSLCRKLYGVLLSHFVTDGPALATKLMEQAEQNKRTAALIVGDFSFDTFEGFSFVRRIPLVK
jgi:hypothetical protein